MKMKFWLILLGVVLLGMSTSSVYAVIETVDMVAEFTDGTGTEAVDAFEGMAGDGWAGPWVTATVSATSTYEVLDTNPLYVDSGNYLSLLTADSTSTGGGRATVARNYTDGIDMTQAYTMSFSVRIDDMDNMDVKKDQFVLFEAADVLSNANSSCFFILKAIANPDVPETYQQWTFSDGDNAGGMTAIDTDISLVQGDIYEFELSIYPDTQTYDATVTDITATGQPSYTATDLGWRAAGTTMGGYLHFTSMCADPADTQGMSIDNINLYQEKEVFLPGGMTEVVANFDGGNATDVVDAFTGMAGDGWESAWSTTERGDAGTIMTVKTSADLDYQEVHAGGGNYLKVEVGSTDGTSRGAVGRSYKTEPGIDYTKDHTIEFTVRIDEDYVGDENFTAMNSEDDQYYITSSNQARSLVNEADTFAIMAMGAGDTWGDQVVRKWAFASGDGAGGVTEYVGSGIGLTQGGVYDFTIAMDVDDGTYDITVDDGTSSYTAEDLGWITSADEVGGFLNFVATCESQFDYRAMSIDNILISQEDPQVPGDANGDGQVDGSDVTILANNWQAGVGDPDPINITFAMGDFNGDGQVDGSDVTILANNWQYGVTTAAAAVPEPSTLVLLFVAAMSLFVVRRRK